MKRAVGVPLARPRPAARFARPDGLRLRVASPPVDGRANRELVRYLAALFGVPKRRVVIEHGRSGRRKRVRVVAPETLPPALARD